MTDKSDIEALASAIYATANQFDAHRGELPAGYADWADEIARDLREHVAAVRRLQPARVAEGYALVPLRPTRDMRDAYNAVCAKGRDQCKAWLVFDAYAAMLAALEADHG